MVKDEEYAEDSILCRTLNLVGNFYPTPKEAQKHSGEWVKKYKY